jgi:hypothetical protein
MKKTKFKTRFQNAIDAFFGEDQPDYREDGLVLVLHSALLKENTIAVVNEKGDAIVKFLKRAFIFFPGSLYLFSFTISIFTFESLWNLWTIILVFLIGSLMTIFGIGDLKKPKHLAIPLSIVAVGIVTYSLFSLFGSVGAMFKYGIYFFPIALIASLLAKSLVDKLDETSN